MKKLILGLLAGAVLLPAQMVESIPFRATLSGANQVPALSTDFRGNGTVWAHVVRNAAGRIISGSVDFTARYQLPADTTLTMMHIHRGAAGANGQIVIDSMMSQQVVGSTGQGSLSFQGQVLPTNTDGISALEDLLVNPAGYYLNIHSTSNPAGIIRGQLERAEQLVLMSRMSTANEDPPITTVDATATGTTVLIVSRRPDQTISSAEVTFDVAYTGVPADSNFTGLHIHRGAAGVNGSVVINSGLTGQVPAGGANGTVRYTADLNVAPGSAALDALYGLYTNPANYYINIHTSQFLGGMIRGQMRRTDRTSFQVTMLPSNEFPPITGLDATGHGLYTAHTLRNQEGRAEAGIGIFNVNYRFPGQVKFQGLHIHNGLAGANGPVSIDSGMNAANGPDSAGGSGNVFRWNAITTTAGMDALNSLLQNPERHYLNIHSSVNQGGAVRGQLAAASSEMPFVTAIISANSDPSNPRVAPLGLMTIFGSNLFKVGGTNGGLDNRAPSALNGTTVRVGNVNAAILEMVRVPTFVPMDYIVAQVPSGVAVGNQTVTVSNANGAGNDVSVPVAQYSPGIYFDTEGGIAFRQSDMSLIRANNPARAGDVIALISTGLGATTPATEPGTAAGANAMTATPSVTLNGNPAEVVVSQAIPGYIGYYWTAVRIPSGVSGPVRAQLTIGGVSSNTVTIPVQ